MRSLILAALMLLLAAQGVTEASAETRVALVIGNANYVNLGPLANPVNDAALMTKTLLAVGFKVFEITDADQRAIKRAIRDFGKRLRRAGPEAVGLFYYAGHGVQAGGTNYLIPLGAPVEDEADLDLEAVSASSVLGQMESAGNALNIVILDACRNNPFKGAFRAATRGLARMTAPSGSLVAYAAAPGQVAADGRSSNSPYTAALAASIREPGLDLLKVFQRARIAVQSETNGQQTPWEEQSLLGDFYFVPAKESAARPPAEIAPGGLVQAFDARRLDLAFWESVKDSETPAALESYLERYPDGVFSGLARVRIEELRQQAASTRSRTQQAVGADPPLKSPPAGGAFYAGHWCEKIGQYLVRWEVVQLVGDQVRTQMHHPAAPPRFLPNATVVPTKDGLRLEFEASAEDFEPQVFTVLDDDTIRRDQPAPADGMTGIRKRCREGDE